MWLVDMVSKKIVKSLTSQHILCLVVWSPLLLRMQFAHEKDYGFLVEGAPEAQTTK